MPKKAKTLEERLEIVEYLLAGLLLERKPNVLQVAKILGVSPNKLVEMYPDRKKSEESSD